MEYTNGITNHNEIYVINNIKNYNTFIQKPGPKKCVDHPRYPSLIIGEPGIIQDGICKQQKKPKTSNTCKTNDNQNHIEIINHRHKEVKGLLGYMGISQDNYHIFRISKEDIKVGVLYINCGSELDQSVDNTLYLADIGIGGKIIQTSNEIVSARNHTIIYQTARSTNATWEIPVPQNGLYEVRIRMAAINGPTNMNITINDRIRRENLDISSTINGEFKRYDIPFRVPVISGTVDISITGTGLINAIDISKLSKEEFNFIPQNRDSLVSNRDTYLFVHRDLSGENLDRKVVDKFIEMSESVLPSKNKFDFY